MLDSIQYQYTPGGQIAALTENNGIEPVLSSAYSAELLGVSTQQELGAFLVKGKGEQPYVGQVLLLPVKGSKQLSLKMKVQSVETLISPDHAWSASCLGPEFREFNLRTVNAECDRCGQSSSLEFISFSGDDNKDAVNGMSLAGWIASLEEQICPKCVVSE